MNCTYFATKTSRPNRLTKSVKPLLVGHPAGPAQLIRIETLVGRVWQCHLAYKKGLILELRRFRFTTSEYYLLTCMRVASEFLVISHCFQTSGWGQLHAWICCKTWKVVYFLLTFWYLLPMGNNPRKYVRDSDITYNTN